MALSTAWHLTGVAAMDERALDLLTDHKARPSQEARQALYRELSETNNVLFNCLVRHRIEHGGAE